MNTETVQTAAPAEPPFFLMGDAPEDKNASTALTLPQRAAVALNTAAVKVKIKEAVAKSATITAVIDPDGREQAHRAGMVLMKLRTGIKAVGKTAREDATAFSKAVITAENELIDLVSPEEDRIFKLRDAYDEQERVREEARAKAEKDRVERIEYALNSMRAELLWASGNNTEQIRAKQESVAQTDMSAEFWQEYHKRAMEVKDDVIAGLAAAFDAQLAVEQEAARVKAEQEAEAARVAEQALENARIAAELKKQQDALAERERLAAVEREAAALIAARELERVQNELKAAQAKLEADRKAFEAQQQAIADKAAADAAAEVERKELACATEAAEASDLAAPVDESKLTVLIDRDNDLFGTASGIDTPEQAQAKNDRASAALAMLVSMPPVEGSGFDLAAGHDETVEWTLPSDGCLTVTGDVSISLAPLSFSYSGVGDDVLTVEGINYSGEIFRQLGGMLEVGAQFTLARRECGTITIIKGE